MISDAVLPFFFISMAKRRRWLRATQNFSQALDEHFSAENHTQGTPNAIREPRLGGRLSGTGSRLPEGRPDRRSHARDLGFREGANDSLDFGMPEDDEIKQKLSASRAPDGVHANFPRLRRA
jgi:hypothetical protein